MTDEPIDTRGVYLIADSPLSAIPLALEDGRGDKGLLADALYDELTDAEIETLCDRLTDHLDGDSSPDYASSEYLRTGRGGAGE